MLVIVLSSFFLGAKFSGGNSSATEPEPIKYDMIGYYMQEDRDYATEASQIQSMYKTGMSTSKIKHLLIYIDGMAKEYDVNYNLIKAVITTKLKEATTNSPLPANSEKLLFLDFEFIYILFI